MTKKKNSIFKAELYEKQKPIYEFLKSNTISILTAAPGCGKDFICMYTALEDLINKEVDNVIITKPIVEVGRSIGYLPGDLHEKLDPYRKSFDAIIEDILGKSDAERIKNLKKKIIFEPINFVRGNTFKNSIVILSEAQNCTLHEIISFMTRLHESSKMFINGDLMQSDIGNKSGLEDILKIITNVKGIEHKTLGDEFQTRHPMIVQLNKEYIKYRKDGSTR